MASRPKPQFQTPSIATLSTKEEIDIRKAYDLELSILIEKKRRAEAEKAGTPRFHIEPNHLAFKSAYPLRKYIREAFPIIVPGNEYKDNWHIDAMCEVLEAATVGEIKKLLINVPRRHMKSTCFSVMWPTWVWTFIPHTIWLFASFNEKFAYRDSEFCMKIFASEYYQQRFGSSFQPSLHTWRKAKLENTKGGVRECFGVGKGTGSGGDFVLVDDPHQIDEAESETVTKKTVKWYLETYYNNVNNPETAVRAIIHQRVSEQDLTGEILARELDYEHLCLPARYEDDHPHKNSVSKPLKLGKISQFEHTEDRALPVGDDKLWMDPRDPEAPKFGNAWYRKWYEKHYAARGFRSKGEGELLWPDHYNEKHIAEMVRHIEAYGESAQLQQRPVKRGGNFFNSAHFEEIAGVGIEYRDMALVRYWDKAGSEGAGDWTVGMLVGRSAKRPFTLYILDIYRARVGLYERMQKQKDLAEQDMRDYIEGDRFESCCASYTIAIEKEGASAGKDIAQIERDYLIGYNVVIDIPRGKKGQRALPVQNIAQAGRIKLLKGKPWRNEFIRELERFDPDPKKKSQVDDQIDALSGAVKFLIFGQRTQQRGAYGGAY